MLDLIPSLLGGSWVVKSRGISPVIWVISTVTLLITPLITTHEPPRRAYGSGFFRGFGVCGLGLWVRGRRSLGDVGVLRLRV